MFILYLKDLLRLKRFNLSYITNANQALKSKNEQSIYIEYTVRALKGRDEEYVCTWRA